MSENRNTLPQGWEWKKLGDIVVEVSSKTSAKECQEMSYISLENIESHTGKLINISSIKESNIVGTCSKFTAQTVIYSKLRPYLNKVATPNFDGVGTTELIVLNPNQNLDKNYLANFLRSGMIVSIIDASSYGAKMPRTNSKFLKNLDIPLPPLEEQRRIVGVLDGIFAKIDTSIALLDANIASATSLMPSALNEVFEELGEKWEIVKIENLCTKITDGTHATPKYIDMGIPFLSVKDITNGKISFENTRYISKEEHEFLSKRCNVAKNDILYTKVGTTGIAKVVDVDIDFSIFVSIALLKPIHNQIQSKFFEFMLNSPNCYEQAQGKTRGVANRNLVLKDIKDILLPLPPLDIQTQTVAYLDALHVKVEALKKAQQTKKEELLALKASLLETAFKGEL